MTELEKTIEKAENALRMLKRAKADPTDEISLLVAYGDLSSAKWTCRHAFAEMGFAGPTEVED